MHQILAAIRGVATLLFIVVSLCFWFFPFFLPCAIAKLLVPKPGFRLACTRWMVWICWRWMDCIDFAMDYLSGQKIVIDSYIANRPDGRFLLVSNHQSWADILLLIRALRINKLPFPRFFIKQELIWIPIIGFATWALDFPYMKRYSKQQIARNPGLKGQDLETTRQACEIYRHQPVTVINFAEGTRSTAPKRASQKSPYQHLLRPKAGGTAFMLYAMGDVLDEVMEATIIYTGTDKPTIWNYWCGTMPEVRVNIHSLEIPRQYYGGDYQNDEAFQESFRSWMNDYWGRKDRIIGELRDAAAERR